jgi:hypothetical protein
MSLKREVLIVEIKKKLLDIVRDKIRFKHYSISTERTYVHWIKHYIFFHNKKHPMPQAIKQRLLAQVDYVAQIHKKDLEDGFASVYMPYALEKKYPKAQLETKLANAVCEAKVS